MYVWLASLLFGSLVGLFPFAESEHNTFPDEPALKLIPDAVDFGLIFDGANPVKTVVLRNEGTSSCTIQRIRSDCGCAVPRILLPGGKEINLDGWPPSRPIGELEPGQEARLDVCFITLGSKKGKYSKHIYIILKDENTTGYDVKVKAEIIDSVKLEPEILDMGEVVRGLRAKGTVIMRSVGIGDFSVTGIKNLPTYLTFNNRKLSSGKEAATSIEIATREEPPLGEWYLALQASLENEHVSVAYVPFTIKIIPKVRFKVGDETLKDELDFGVFPQSRGKTLSVDIVNLVPQIPYHPLEIDLEEGSLNAFIENQIETIEPGELYRLTVRLKPDIPGPGFLRGCIKIKSDHPDLFLKKLHLLGWASP